MRFLSKHKKKNTHNAYKKKKTSKTQQKNLTIIKKKQARIPDKTREKTLTIKQTFEPVGKRETAD